MCGQERGRRPDNRAVILPADRAGLIAVGVLGIVFGGSGFDAGGDVQGDDFIIFEVNGWHNVVHIATGAFLVVRFVAAVVAGVRGNGPIANSLPSLSSSSSSPSRITCSSSGSR
jgi:hypothetical protein